MRKFLLATTAAAVVLTLTGRVFAENEPPTATVAPPRAATTEGLVFSKDASEAKPIDSTQPLETKPSADPKPLDTTPAAQANAPAAAELGPVAQQLRDIVEGKLSQYVPREQDRVGVALDGLTQGTHRVGIGGVDGRGDRLDPIEGREGGDPAGAGDVLLPRDDRQGERHGRQQQADRQDDEELVAQRAQRDLLDDRQLPVRSTTPGLLLADCLELARDVRELDMRASPYDLRDWGYEPVRIETPEGKAAYVAAQRGFSERGQALRARLVQVTSRALQVR